MAAAEGEVNAATDTSEVATLATAVAKIADLQRERLEEKRDDPQLSFDLGARAADVGLGGLADQLPPTPSSVAKLERAAKDSFKHKQRYYGGTSEDLASGFRPQWMKPPRLGPSIAGKTPGEKAKNAAADRSARGSEEAIGYSSYAAFTSHVLDWCIKMVLLKQMEIIDVVNYLGVLAYVAQEFGGTKTAYWYEHLTREELAKAAVWRKDDAAKTVGALDVDRVRGAKLRAEQPGRTTNDRRPEQQEPAPKRRRRGGNGGGNRSGGKGDNNNAGGERGQGHQDHKQGRKGGDQGSGGAGHKGSGRDRR